MTRRKQITYLPCPPETRHGNAELQLGSFFDKAIR